MIHQLLNLTRPLFVFDCETTGVDPQTDRVVELGFQQWDATGLVKEYRTLVNPGIPIPAGATKVHGITNFQMMCCQTCGNVPDDVAPDHCRCETPKRVPIFAQLASSLAKGFTDCDFAGQNVRFDLQITAAEMKRVGQPWSYSGARIIDSSRLETIAIPRSLSHLHEKYAGMKHDGAHGALSDVRAAATVIMKQLETHEVLPRDLDELHQLSWPGQIDPEGKFKFIDGVPTCMFGKYRNRAMRDIPISYYDWLCNNDFTDDVKKLAGLAKLGQWPEKK